MGKLTRLASLRGVRRLESATAQENLLKVYANVRDAAKAIKKSRKEENVALSLIKTRF